MLSRSQDPLLDINFFVGTMCIPVWIRIHDLSTAVLWMLMLLVHRNSKAFPGPSWVVDRQLAFSYNQDVEKVSTTNSSSWMSSLRLLPYRDPVPLPGWYFSFLFSGMQWRHWGSGLLMILHQRAEPTWSQRFCVCVACFFTPQCPSQVKSKEVQVWKKYSHFQSQKMFFV